MGCNRGHITGKTATGLTKRAMRLIQEGRTLEVMMLNGRAYSLQGTVVRGNMIGRTLGYPTANLDAPTVENLVPAQGVYSAMVQADHEWYPAMVNIGIRPTLNLKGVTIEAHIFGFSRDIYGKTISIHFLEFIRKEMRFTSLSELREQLLADSITVSESIKKLHPRIQPSNEGLFISS